jgi:hypothetical protein
MADLLSVRPEVIPPARNLARRESLPRRVFFNDPPSG